jgi:hypothetical protein
LEAITRDNHSGYPEILDAYEREGLYFGAIRIYLETEVASFEFGVEQRGYVALKRVLQTHPFDPLDKHRYFFTGNFGKKDVASNVVSFRVRIEQGMTSKKFDFDGPISLVSNLRWFMELKDFQEAAALRRLTD